MRAKRSKKYRKTMQQYEMSFGFREPYQVLVDSNLLLSLHAFSMPLLPSLERTLHGKVKPFITKCCLTSLNNLSASPKTKGRSPYLPSPEELPLRYCDHGERGTLSETECLLELVSGGATATVLGEVKVGEPGSKVPKNKEHYIIATADMEVRSKYMPDLFNSRAGTKRKRTNDDENGEGSPRNLPGDLRDYIRRVPGVPVIYVKRSVMILEELSAMSMSKRKREEREKMAEGLSIDTRKKLKLLTSKEKEDAAFEKNARENGAGVDDSGDEDDEDDDDEAKTRATNTTQVEDLKKKAPKRKGQKGPNPLSVKKKKVKVGMPGNVNGSSGTKERQAEVGGEDKPKVKRRRRHGGGGNKGDGGGEGESRPREAVAEVVVD